MLLTSTGVISRSQQEESILLLRKIEELNKNTARLIAEAGKLIQESKQLSAQVKSLETPARSYSEQHSALRENSESSDCTKDRRRGRTTEGCVRDFFES